jgi:hypothetical protein
MRSSSPAWATCRVRPGPERPSRGETVCGGVR